MMKQRTGSCDGSDEFLFIWKLMNISFVDHRRNMLDSRFRFRLLIRIRCKVFDRGPAIMTDMEGGGRTLRLLQSPILTLLTSLGSYKKSITFLCNTYFKKNLWFIFVDCI